VKHGDPILAFPRRSQKRERLLLEEADPTTRTTE
jgi:hypothetical protein